MKILTWLRAPYKGKKHDLLKSIYRYFTNYQFRCTARVNHRLTADGLYAKYLEKRLMSKYHIMVSSATCARGNLKLPHPVGIVIGAGVVLGDEVTIYQNVTLGQARGGYPEICNGVILYANVVVCGPVRVGERAVVGAGSVVICDVPDGAVVAGVPARILRMRDSRDEALY